MHYEVMHYENVNCRTKLAVFQIGTPRHALLYLHLFAFNDRVVVVGPCRAYNDDFDGLFFYLG